MAVAALANLGYGDDASPPVRAALAGAALLVIAGAVHVSRRRGIAVDDTPSPATLPAAEGS